MRGVFEHHRDRRRKRSRSNEAKEDIGERVLESANVLFDTRASVPNI